VKKKSSLLMPPLPTPDLPVPANEKLLAWVGDEIAPRDSAKVISYMIIKRSAVCFYIIKLQIYMIDAQILMVLKILCCDLAGFCV